MRVVFKIRMEVNTRVMKKLTNMPVLPLRGLLVYPTMVLHIDVGRERSIAALEHAMLGDSTIFLVTQKDLRVEAPVKSDLFEMGTLAKVKQAMERTQKEYYLREQMKAIQTELGDRDGKTGEIAELRKILDEAEQRNNK